MGNFLNMCRVMGKSEAELGSELSALGRRISVQEHSGNSLKAGFLCFVFFWLAWIFFSPSALPGAALAFCAGAFAAFYFFRSPERELRARSKRIEKHLPFALMQLSVDLNTKIPMDISLGRVS